MDADAHVKFKENVHPNHASKWQTGREDEEAKDTHRMPVRRAIVILCWIPWWKSSSEDGRRREENGWDMSGDRRD